MPNGFWRKIKNMAGRTVRSIAEPEPAKLKEWKQRMEDARTLYGDERAKMRLFTDYYNGTRDVQDNPNTGEPASKRSTNVRNIVYELIESQVDSSIPMPKVHAIHPEDDELAHKIEYLLENKIMSCNLAAINDIVERNVPMVGGDYLYVQWDQNKGTHSQIGDIKVSEIHPKKLIPQPGVSDFDNMDYFFIQQLLTKKTVKKIYGVDVSDAENDEQELTGEVADASTNSDLVTVYTAYYRNDHGGVGVYIWCDRYELLDMEDYESRYLDRCAKCGSVMQNGKCPVCGSAKSKKAPEEYEELVDAIEVTDLRKPSGSTFGKTNIPPMEEEEVPDVDENGNPVMNPDGTQKITVQHKKKKIPYYKPNVYPIVLRKNITANDKLLGDSDTKAIVDQQDTIKKLGTKINEKLMKGGSYVTLPRGKKVELNDKELKVIRLDNAAEKALVDVINVQPNVQNDENYLEINYNWAKSTLGITDAYQGQFKSSETSGTARQYAINQAAGRLESKRVLKNEAYAHLYEIMFKFWLAYADQTTEITSQDADGNQTYGTLDRHEFLRIDKAGEFYWDDEFIFDTDPTSTLMANREAMWNQTDLKLQSGAFGPLGELDTLRTYWSFMKASGYPNAGLALSTVEQRIQKQEEMQQKQEEMMQQIQANNQTAEQIEGGGDQNEMPGMPG